MAHWCSIHAQEYKPDLTLAHWCSIHAQEYKPDQTLAHWCSIHAQEYKPDLTFADLNQVLNRNKHVDIKCRAHNEFLGKIIHQVR